MGSKWMEISQSKCNQKTSKKSFDEVFLDKIKGPLGINKGEVKQCRLDCHSNLVSQKEFLQQLKIKEAESKT